MWRKQKVCTKCGSSGPFDAAKKGRFGVQARCKACRREANKAWLCSPAGRASRMWTHMVARCGRDPAYLRVKILFTREKFMQWAVLAIRRWQLRHGDVVPTIDRVKPQGHYAPGNVRLLSRGENSRLKPFNKNVHAPKGKAWCGKCKSYKAKAQFSPRPSRPAGVQGACKPCHAAYVKARKQQAKADLNSIF